MAFQAQIKRRSMCLPKDMLERHSEVSWDGEADEERTHRACSWDMKVIAVTRVTMGVMME